MNPYFVKTVFCFLLFVGLYLIALSFPSAWKPWTVFPLSGFPATEKPKTALLGAVREKRGTPG